MIHFAGVDVSLVQVVGPMSTVVEHPADGQLPPGTCADIELEVA